MSPFALKPQPARKPKPPVTVDELRSMRGDITDVLDERGAAWRQLGACERPVVLACDVGEQMAFARQADRLTVVTCKADQSMVWLDTLDKPELWAGIHLVVIEDAYLGENPVTFAVLSRYVGAIMAKCHSMRVPAWRVKASVWQAGLGITGEREQRKAMSLTLAKARGHGFQTDHQADAANLAWWARGGK